ncbi:MAG: hypothetical protein ACNI3A_03950 [Desulfovibrio sp.]|uniref:hypothetical protein n=1 Tax=Desulfovibrio sp. 7SRBS1 TaxID=3378064 RepID=UPI003B403720
MKIRNTLLVMLLAAVVACGGCADVKKSWRWVVSGVAPAPTIDLNTKELNDENQERLAQEFAQVDTHLQNLYRTMSAQDSYPDDAWIELTLRNYPWLSGLQTVDSNGTVMLERAVASMKPVNPKPLIDYGKKWFEREPLSYVDKTDLGPEIYIANAFFENRNWQGLILVHFDFRSLIRAIGYDGPLIVITKDAILWPGKDEATAHELLQAPWEQLTAEEVQGETSVASNGKTYIWFSRYFGGTKLFYLLAVQPEESGSWLF